MWLNSIGLSLVGKTYTDAQFSEPPFNLQRAVFRTVRVMQLGFRNEGHLASIGLAAEQPIPVIDVGTSILRRSDPLLGQPARRAGSKTASRTTHRDYRQA
jgi:hypothetical protein